MLMLDIAVVNTALSRIAEDLNAGLGGLQWVVDAYTLALAATVLTFGSLADRFGRRRLFTAGLTLFTVASAACAAATGIDFLVAARAVQGVGAAIMFAVSLAILADAFPGAKERTGALAAYGATIGASFAVGPLVGGALTSGIDWQWIFLINVPLGIGCIWITRTYVRESRDPNARRVDIPGQVTLGAGLFLLVLGLLRGNEEGWGSTPIVAALGAAAVLLVAFLAIESRVKEPMLPLALFRNPNFAGAQIAALAISATFFAIFLYITLYLQQILGYSAIEAGLVYLPATLVIFLVSGATASVAEKVSPRIMIGVGLALVAGGMGLMTIADETSSWLTLMPGFLMAAVGTGLFNPALTAVALGSAPLEQSGLAAGVNDTFRQAGIAVGVAGLGALIPAASALGGGSPADYVSGLHDALWVGAGVAAVGALAAGVLIPLAGVPACYPAVAGLYALGALLVALLRVPPGPHLAAARPSFGRALRDAARLVVEVPAVRTLSIAGIVCEVFAFSYQTALPVLARDVLAAGPEGLGTLMTVMGVGSVLGSVGIVLIQPRRQGLTLIVSLAVFALLLVALAASRSLPLSVGIMGLIGIAQAIYLATNNTLVQLATPDALQGRVMSLYLMTWGLMPLGALPQGVLAEWFGAPVVAGGAGLLGSVIVLMLAVGLPRLRQL
jgi:EmrB/QacA subfamily drug resistance transporter